MERGDVKWGGNCEGGEGKLPSYDCIAESGSNPGEGDCRAGNPDTLVFTPSDKGGPSGEDYGSPIPTGTSDEFCCVITSPVALLR